MKPVIKISVNEKPTNVNFLKITANWLVILSIFITLSHIAKTLDKEISKSNAHASEFRGSRSPAIVPNK